MANYICVCDEDSQAEFITSSRTFSPLAAKLLIVAIDALQKVLCYDEPAENERDEKGNPIWSKCEKPKVNTPKP